MLRWKQAKARSSGVMALTVSTCAFAAGSLSRAAWVRIPVHRGHLLRFDRGQATDLMAATIPI